MHIIIIITIMEASHESRLYLPSASAQQDRIKFSIDFLIQV